MRREKYFTLFCIILHVESKCNKPITKIETIKFSPVFVNILGNLYQFTFTSLEKIIKKDSLCKPYMLKYEPRVISISVSVYMNHNILTFV